MKKYLSFLCIIFCLSIIFFGCSRNDYIKIMNYGNIYQCTETIYEFEADKNYFIYDNNTIKVYFSTIIDKDNLIETMGEIIKLNNSQLLLKGDKIRFILDYSTNDGTTKTSIFYEAKDIYKIKICCAGDETIFYEQIMN